VFLLYLFCLIDTSNIESNGKHLVDLLGRKEVVPKNTALSRIPNMVKVFDQEGVPSLVNAVFKDHRNIDKLLPSLAVLNGFYKIVKLSPNITKIGITTELVDGKFINTKQVSYVNALEIFG